MWNRHTKVPKIAPAHLFSISGMNFSVVAVSYKVNTNIFKFSLIWKRASQIMYLLSLKIKHKMKMRLLKRNCIYSGKPSGTVCHFHPNCAIFHLLSLFSLARAISSTCSYELLFLRFLMSVGHNKRWLEHIIHYFVSQLQRCFRKKKTTHLKIAY